ncbi:Type 1 glutamine amidotransferase-like domain-containing protein [Candidatus Woesebacteria bacterium]|nr:Type 1 glutamine amidotransferase-like domain-containing protein [Candidatus Woesebacteria bacterium]
MSKLFLTSSVSDVASHLATRVDFSNGRALVFITTPVEPKDEASDLSWLQADRQSLVDNGFEVTNYTITGKNREQLLEELSSFNFIYISGGNTFYLLVKSQESGFDSVIQELVNVQGKTYIGTSAGSIIAGPKCPDYLLEMEEVNKIQSSEGYGLVNFTILPHWGSSTFKEKYLDKRLAIAYRDNQVPLILLTDSQYISIEDGNMEIIETRT